VLKSVEEIMIAQNQLDSSSRFLVSKDL
jgi:hypothetical protein